MEHIYGRLTIIEEVKIEADGVKRYRCKCVCGNESIVRAKNLIRGFTKSCGCLQREIATTTNTLHGDCKTNRAPEYRSWQTMQYRCYNPNAPYYSRYGGRGITVCEKWIGDYKTFLADMGRRPSLEHSLDRIDNDGDYSPDNCRWSTRKEQARHRSTSRMITAFNQTYTLAEWAEKTGIKASTISVRLQRGCSSEDAVSNPVHVPSARSDKG